MRRDWPEDTDRPTSLNTLNPATAEQKHRYPRSWWFDLVRVLLAISGMTAGPLYLFIFCNAVIQHTLFTRDRNLLSLSSIIEVVLLTAGGVWAFNSMVKEQQAEKRRRKAEWQRPFAVQVEQHWRKELAKAREQGDQLAEVLALANIGFWRNENEQDGYIEVEPYLTQALALARSSDDHFHEERCLSNLARCASAHNDLEKAETLYRESLAVTLTLTREQMPSPHASDASVLDEVARSYCLLGRFLAEQRGNTVESCQMFAEAEKRYREEAHMHESAAQMYRFKLGLRTFEKRLQRRALAFAKDMHNLQQQYESNVSK